MTAYLRPEFKDAIQTPIVLEEKNTAKDAKLLAATAKIKAVAEQALPGDLNAVLGGILREMRQMEAEAGWFTSLEEKTFGLPAGGKAEALVHKLINSESVPELLKLPGLPYFMALRKALNLAPGQALDPYYTLLFTAALHSFMKNHKLEEKVVVLTDNKDKAATDDEANLWGELPYGVEEIELTTINVQTEEIRPQTEAKDASLAPIDPAYFELNSVKPKADGDNGEAEVKESSKKHYTAEEISSVYENLKIDKAQCEAAIDELCKHRYAADVVQELFEKIPAAYDAIKEKKGEVSKRKDYIDFLRVINTMMKDARVKDRAYLNLVRHAIALMIKEDIESEKLTWNSDLNDLCSEILNVKRSSDISNLDRYSWYSTLQGFMPKVGSTEFVSRFVGRLLKRISATYEDMENGHIHPLAQGVKTAVNVCTELTAAVAIGTFSGSLVSFAPGENFFSRAVGNFGRKYWGYPGKLVGERVGLVLETAAVSSAISKSIKWGADYVIRLPGEAAEKIVNLPFAITKMISNYLATAPEKPFYLNLEFIGMLLSLPNELLDAKTKEKLSKIDIYREPFVPQPEAAPAPVKNVKRRNSLPTMFKPNLDIEPEGRSTLFQGEIKISGPS